MFILYFNGATPITVRVALNNIPSVPKGYLFLLGLFTSQGVITSGDILVY